MSRLEEYVYMTPEEKINECKARTNSIKSTVSKILKNDGFTPTHKAIMLSIVTDLEHCDNILDKMVKGELEPDSKEAEEVEVIMRASISKLTMVMRERLE